MPANGYLFQTSDGTTKGDMITSVPTTVSLMEVTASSTHQLKMVLVTAMATFGFKIYVGTSGSAETAVTVNISNVNDAAVCHRSNCKC